MEDFVPYELAVKLKEKGFPQDIQYCIGWYPTEYYKNSCIGEYFERELQEIEYYEDRVNAIHIIENEKKGVTAPTISQVLKWLREEKGIYVSVEVEREDWFEYKIVQTIKNTRTTGTRVYETYPEAILAGITYAIDNLI